MDVNSSPLEGVEGVVEWLITPGDSGYYVGHCRQLGLATQGKTWRELMSRISDSMELLFASIATEDDLDAFLLDRGWTQVPRLEEFGELDIPFIPRKVGIDEYSAAAFHQ